MIWSFFKKELNLFFRGSGTVLTSVIFSLSLFTLFRFTLQGSELPIHMILWVTHLLSVVFLLIQSQEWEREGKVYRIFSLSYIDFDVIFWGKIAAITIVMLFLWFIEVFIWFLFFDLSLVLKKIDQFFYFMAMIGFLSSLALSMLGIQASTIAIHSKYPVVILFMIFLPLNLPISISSSQLVSLAVKGGNIIDSLSSVSVILAFTMLYAGLGVLFFGKLLEE